jgi:hypothetical protein
VFAILEGNCLDSWQFGSLEWFATADKALAEYMTCEEYAICGPEVAYAGVVAEPVSVPPGGWLIYDPARR